MPPWPPDEVEKYASRARLEAQLPAIHQKILAKCRELSDMIMPGIVALEFQAWGSDTAEAYFWHVRVTPFAATIVYEEPRGKSFGGFKEGKHGNTTDRA